MILRAEPARAQHRRADAKPGPAATIPAARPAPGHATFEAGSWIVVIRMGGRGEKVPYVQFEGAKYRGDALAKARHKAGETVRFRMKATCAHQAVIFLGDGSEFDGLTAYPPWDKPHTLSERQKCLELIRENKLPRLSLDLDYVLMLRKHLYKKYLEKGDKRSVLVAAAAEEAGKADASRQSDCDDNSENSYSSQDDDVDYSSKYESK